MRLRFGFLADYAHFTVNGKLLAVGVFDAFHSTPNMPELAPVMVPAHAVCAVIAASGAEAGPHAGRMRAVNQDGRVVFEPPVNPFILKEAAAGTEATYTWVNNIVNTAFPGVGAYTWEYFVDDVKIGEVPFWIVQLPAPEQLQGNDAEPIEPWRTKN